MLPTEGKKDCRHKQKQWCLTQWMCSGRSTFPETMAKGSVKWATRQASYLKISSEHVSNQERHRGAWLGQSRAEFFWRVSTTTISPWLSSHSDSLNQICARLLQGLRQSSGQRRHKRMGPITKEDEQNICFLREWWVLWKAGAGDREWESWRSGMEFFQFHRWVKVTF